MGLSVFSAPYLPDLNTPYIYTSRQGQESVAGKHRNTPDFQQAQQFHQQGRIVEAISAYEALLKAQPHNADLLYLLGTAMAQCANWSAAEERLQQCIQIHPGHLAALGNLALVYEKTARFNKALDCYQRALKLAPGNPDILANIADLMLQTGDVVSAHDYAIQALSTNPNQVTALNTLARVFQHQGEAEQAENALRKALVAEPKNPVTLCNLGALHLLQENFKAAADELKKSLDLNPDSPHTLSNYGLLQVRTHQFEKAGVTLQRATTLAPEHADAWTNLGFLHQEQGDLSAAFTAHNHAIELAPNSANARWSRATTHLLAGNWREGWQDYQHGLQTSERRKRDFGLTEWQGQEVRNKTILVYAEQGLGDEIMFASCFQDLIDSGAHLIIECNPRLTDLFKRAFPAADITGAHQSSPTDWIQQYANIDYQVAAGSLPLYLRNDTGDFPGTPFLVAEEKWLEHWQTRYHTLGAGPKIGISWRAGTRVNPKRRSTQLLPHWRGLLATQGCHFINLQYGETHEEIQQVEKDLGVIIHDWPDSDPLQEQDSFAGKIAALDLVISVSNATVHLAGALGKETWSILPLVPSWRWTLKGEKSVWYQSLKLYRQTSAEDWEPVFDQLGDDLKKYVQAKDTKKDLDADS